MSHIVCTILFEHLSVNKIKENRVLKTDHYKIAIYSDRMEMDTDILNWMKKLPNSSHIADRLYASTYQQVFTSVCLGFF